MKLRIIIIRCKRAGIIMKQYQASTNPLQVLHSAHINGVGIIEISI